MKRLLAIFLATLFAFPPAAFADSLSISAWSTGDSLNSTNLNSRHTTITNWANGTIADDNIKAAAAIAGSKIDLTSGTARISHSTSVTSDAPVFTSGQTWNNAATVFSLWRGTVTNTNSASTSRLLDLRVDSTIVASISRTGQLFLNSQDYASGPRTLMDGAWLNVASATYTDNATAASGTAPRFIAYAFQRPAVAAANTSVTTTNAATVFIASAPVTSTNMTLTNRYALWVDQGDVRVGGTIYASGSISVVGSLAFGDGTSQSTAGPAITGMIAYFNLSACPQGWSEYTSLRGRYAVGMPLSGTLEATVGSALTDQEARAAGAHTHSQDGTVNAETVGAGAISVQQFGTANTGSTGTSTTPAPYIQLLACRKS